MNECLLTAWRMHAATEHLLAALRIHLLRSSESFLRLTAWRIRLRTAKATICNSVTDASAAWLAAVEVQEVGESRSERCRQDAAKEELGRPGPMWLLPRKLLSVERLTKLATEVV
jgi:hypothetical protein